MEKKGDVTESSDPACPRGQKPFARLDSQLSTVVTVMASGKSTAVMGVSTQNPFLKGSMSAMAMLRQLTGNFAVADQTPRVAAAGIPGNLLRFVPRGKIR